MFSVYKDFHSATAVEHAISCHFFNKTEKNLLVAGTNSLKVFRLIPNIEFGFNLTDGVDRPPKMKLECVCDFTLHANIMCMQSISLANADRDSLLLSFRDAKLSIVEYDPETHDLQTLSLHYFEEDDLKNGWTQHHQAPLVRVDPENRCAVMLLYGTKIAIFPFQRDSTLDDSHTNDVKPLIDSRTGATKQPILSSYVFPLNKLSEQINNVLDIQFLHGYYEPTLLILFEPIRTFAGRVAVRNDTCSIVAISINVQQKVHPVIWTVTNLPFDCTQVIPVPKPIGGVILFSINAVIYLNQSTPPFGISLNALAETYTSFPLRSQDDLCLTLDCAQATFIYEDTLVISLKSGDLYVLTLISDNMRSIQRFHFDKVAASVLTTCIAAYEDNFLFLGSRLGNSLLLRYLETGQERNGNCNGNGNEFQSATNNDEETNTSRVMDTEEVTVVPATGTGTVDDAVEKTLYDCVASDVFDIRDVDEFEMYGNDTNKTTLLKIKRYVFEVCDSLINIGPCGSSTIGESAFLSSEFSKNCDFDLEIVTTSGFGKNGALCVLQKSIRPQLVTTFDLPDCFNMWSLSKRSGQHSYLLLSQESSSIVLETSSEVNEMEKTGFVTNEVTVYACNLGKNRYYAQVTVRGVHLLQNNNRLQFLPLKSTDESIVFACSSDPYIALLTNIGQVYLIVLKENKQPNSKLMFLKSNLENNPEVVAISLYRDVSGMFTDKIPEEFTKVAENVRLIDAASNVDDEDEHLYGDNSAFEMPTVESSVYLNDPKQKKSKCCWWKRYLLDVRTTYWLFAVRDNMNLEVYSMPDLNLSYLIKDVGHGHQVLTDELESISTSGSSINLNEHVTKSKFEVQEVRMVALGSHGSRPLLFIRVTNCIYIYEAFRFAKGNIKIRFRKFPTCLHYLTNVSGFIETENTDLYAIQEKKCRLRYFSNITGYNGVFVAGEKPYWIFLTYRGELRTHPMTIDGSVTCFTSFNNMNCPHGFIYLNGSSQVRIGILPTHLNYDAPWPIRKVPLRATPYFVSYHVESKTYCLVTSVQEATNQYFRFNGEDKELTQETRPATFPIPVQDQFSVILFSPIAWEPIPNTKINLDEWEHVTCMKNVSLSYEGTTSGLRGYIVVGTNYNYGEDVTSRGRIYIWQLKDNDLVGVAFIDTQIYTHQILAIKNLILVGDVYKSISLLRFQEEYRTLSLISRDYNACQIVSAEFVVDNMNLGFLVCDAEKNFRLYMYQPKSRESHGGMKLMRKADFHIGQIVNSFFRIKCKTENLLENRKQFTSVAENRQITMSMTLDGSMGCLLPITERTYRRLLMLQNVLNTFKPHVAGLNPKEFREQFAVSTKTMPDLHIIGNILLAKKFPYENLYCKWRLQMGPNWHLVSGELSGETQVDVSLNDNSSNWNYPLDIHINASGIDGWPKIYTEIYHLDYFGRSFLCGIGFVCVPMSPGKHLLTSYHWKPHRSFFERICQFMFAQNYRISHPDFVCSPNDRFSLRTESVGVVKFSLQIIMKDFDKFGIEYK